MQSTFLAVAILLAPPHASDTIQDTVIHPEIAHTLQPAVVPERILLKGRVVGAAGDPVSGATLWTSGGQGHGKGGASAVTGADGRFTIGTAHPEARLMFVARDGYRMTGAAVLPEAESSKIRLPHRNEPAAPLVTTRPANEQRAKVLKELLEPVYDRMLEAQIDEFAGRILEMLAPYDRQYALDHALDLRDEFYRTSLLLTLGEIEQSLQEASQIRDPHSRTAAYLSAAAVVRDPAARRQIFADAVVAAGQVPDTAHRVVLLSKIADRMFEAGERDAALALVSETLAPAAELRTVNFDAYARGRFAETLVEVDPEESLALVAGMWYPAARRTHYGNIAYRLAASDPEQAERVLQLIRDTSRDKYTQRVCYRMAAVDLERARRLAAGVNNRAHVYGAMAVALREQQPDVACDLLREAFAILVQRRPHALSGTRSFSDGVVLLRFAEQVDPQLASEFLWQVVALHPGPRADYSRWGDAELQRDKDTARLVLLLTLYGREPGLCRQIMAPILERAERRELENHLDMQPIVAAMILVDPDRALAWHRRFFAKVEPDDLHFPEQPWQAMAAVLADSDEQVWSRVQYRIFGQPAIDADDF